MIGRILRSLTALVVHTSPGAPNSSLPSGRRVVLFALATLRGERRTLWRRIGKALLAGAAYCALFTLFSVACCCGVPAYNCVNANRQHILLVPGTMKPILRQIIWLAIALAGHGAWPPSHCNAASPSTASGW